MTASALSLTERLAQHLLRPVPEIVRTKARLHLLDWLGCVAGALRSEAACALSGSRGDTMSKAALLGNVQEMDDVHRTALLHPGPVIWPAALSAGTMDEALTAAVRGYEAMIAIGATFDAHHYAFYHPTATAGVFGAAAATGEADEPRIIANALALAGSVSGGLWQTRRSANLGKQWHIAHAVATGRSAATFALDGVTGPLDVLEGEQGIHAATCREPKPLVLGQGWRMQEVSFKPWGACRHAHPAIDAALLLRDQRMLDGNVLVETYADALTFCDRPDPATPLEAKFSLQHAVAVVAERGAPRLADFEPDAIAALAHARARVRVAEGSDIGARYPGHFGARVTAGGRSVELIDTLGDPERPLSDKAIIEKAKALMDWGGVGADAEEAVTACLDGNDRLAVFALLERWL
jgi:2-methylcitrate dehydratase PrpD